jgi:membrane protease YdiL (CAAX protease family)
MSIPDLFINRYGRVRAGWRLAVFCAVFFFAMTAGLLALRIALGLLLPPATIERLLELSTAGFMIQAAVIFIPAALVGWVCAHVIEDLPWRSLGWAMHRGWMRDLLLGVGFGALSIGLLALVGLVFGGYRFTAPNAPDWAAIFQTLILSGLVFLAGAAAEEMLFRGYPLQTLLRSWPALLALVLPSLAFATVHLDNPNIIPFFTFTNTALAGVWLAVSYWRTRSLWFPLGLHWGWNWTMGAFLGSPVSGITELTPAPLLRFEDAGPAWLGGGPYGFEGGAACTLALLASTIFIWRTRLLVATPELREYTDGENPNPDPPPIFAHTRYGAEPPRASAPATGATHATTPED